VAEGLRLAAGGRDGEQCAGAGIPGQKASQQGCTQPVDE